MDSNEIEMEQSTTDLKYLWLLKKIVVRFLVILSNVYDFAKENSGDFTTTVVSVENILVSEFGRGYKKLKNLARQIVVFVDVKFDKYAPSIAKKVVAKYQSLIYKTKPLVKLLLTTTQTVIIPLINTTIFLLQTTKYFVINIVTTTTTTSSTLLVGKTQTPLQKSLNTTQTLLQSSPLTATTQTLLQNSLDTSKSLVPETILQKGPDLANQARDTTKSLVGGIPLVGNVVQSLASNPTDVANQIVNTPNSLLDENPILGVVNSASQKSLETTKSLIPNTIFQKAPDLANQAQDTTKSLFGEIPLVGNVAKSLVTNPTDLANQIVSTTNSLVNKNPGLEAVNSAAQSSLDTAKSLVPHTILQKGPDLANQAQDMTKSLVGGIPLMGNVAESLATNPTDLASQILNTTNSLVNENPLLGAVSSAAQNLGNKPQTTGTKAALQSAYMTLKLAGIPVIAQLWYEIVNEYPLVGKLSEFILPVVERLFELYNEVVTSMNGKGYNISGYLPLVPIDEMKAAYKLVKTSRDGLSAVGDLLGVNNTKGLSSVGDILGMNKNN